MTYARSALPRARSLAAAGPWLLAMLAFGCSSADQASRPATSAAGDGVAGGAQMPPGNPGAHAGHGQHGKHGEHGKGDADQSPLRTDADGSRIFGAELAAGVAVTPLADVLKSPEAWNGKVVRVEGQIHRVCKAMGCWMEIRGEGTPDVRVPTAGHSFFLPPDVAGKRTTVEGTVQVEPLDEETKKHLASEGALATESSVSISATSIVVYPDAAPAAPAGR